MSCKTHTDTSDQVWVFLGGGGEDPQFFLQTLFLFSTFSLHVGYLMFFSHSPVSSADALPHPQSHLPFCPPHRPAHFQQVYFKHSNLSQQICSHFHRSPKSGRRNVSRKQHIHLPAVPISHPQAAPRCSLGTQIHPLMHPPAPPALPLPMLPPEQQRPLKISRFRRVPAHRTVMPRRSLATSRLSQQLRQGQCAQPGKSRLQYSSPSLSLC